jgi:uncharacterized Zn finger protein (UPF0148 family)
MREDTGELLSQEQYYELPEETKKKTHLLPRDITDQAIEKLQKPISQSDRRAALKAIKRNRRKSKAARKARRKNR